jgi:hypothetical protein
MWVTSTLYKQSNEFENGTDVSKDYQKERRADGGNGRKQLHGKRATNEHDYLYPLLVVS